MDMDKLTDRAASLGNTVVNEGPGALLEELEQLLPDPWRAQIANFPITALAMGVGLGLFLGLRKGDEILALGTTLVSAAAAENLSKVFGNTTQQA